VKGSLIGHQGEKRAFYQSNILGKLRGTGGGKRIPSVITLKKKLSRSGKDNTKNHTTNPLASDLYSRCPIPNLTSGLGGI